MRPVVIKDFGRGRVTALAAALAPFGSASDSVNLLHNRGKNTAELRNPINRTWATRAANGNVLWAFEYVKSDATIIYLTKVVDTLYTFDALTPGTALGSIEASMTSWFRPSGVNANGKVFIADSGKNYSSDGTSAGTHELQLAAQSSGWITLASAGTATGNAAGTVYYSFTRTQLYDAAEHAPSAGLAVTRTVNQGVTVTNAALVFTDPWTTVTLYRTTAGSTQMYLVASGLTSGSFPYADTTLDEDLNTVSTVHLDNSISASIEKPLAGKHACWHRDRLFLANFSGNLSRVRWSRVSEPTQFENTDTANSDVGKLDGGEVTGLVSFRGSLVVFKTNSIWVMNGDVDEAGFVFAEVVAGYGCISPRTIVKDGDAAIYFLSARGVCAFDLAGIRELSGDIRDEVHTLLHTTYGSGFVAGFEPRNRLYLISVTPSGQTTNTSTFCLNVDTGIWGRFVYGMGKILPTIYTNTASTGPIRNGNGNVKLYVGSSDGYLYELDASNGADGVTSGSEVATVTGYVDGTGVITCSAGAFRTTGNGLLGTSVTLVPASGAARESKIITANAATTVTAANDWTVDPVEGDQILIGALEAVLSFNPSDLGTSQRKRIGRIKVRFKEQTHTYALRVGYALDNDSAPATTVDYAMNNNDFAKLPIHRRCQLFAPYLAMTGVSSPLEIVGIEYDVEILASRGPTR